MSVCETRIVDAIGVEKASGKVVLTVSDHLEWNTEHMTVLQDKISTYLAFIESGELIATYPDARARQPVVDVVCKHEPSTDALEFFTKVTAALRAVRVEFRFRVLSDPSVGPHQGT